MVRLGASSASCELALFQWERSLLLLLKTMRHLDYLSCIQFIQLSSVNAIHRHSKLDVQLLCDANELNNSQTLTLVSEMKNLVSFLINNFEFLQLMMNVSRYTFSLMQ